LFFEGSIRVSREGKPPKHLDEDGAWRNSTQKRSNSNLFPGF
jgi:hypothetical protein